MATFKKNILKYAWVSGFMFLSILATAQKYTNPILHEDYSDPDVIRVGNKFYMVASSFNYVPGLPILSSNDLVHWTLTGYALQQNMPIEHYKKVKHGAGVWAPSIRYHAGEFYIYYPDPDFGIYLIKSKKIEGPWSVPILVQAGKGLIDPCPFWDDNGKAYLVHAYAGSRAGIKSVLTLQEMLIDGTKLIGNGILVYDGHGIDPTVEGPKLYKRAGWYYIFAPAGGVATGWQIVLRAKKIMGPYERKVVMEQGNSAVNGPHQGAWVQTNTGEDWFVHFQDKEAYGRIVHLQPMQWKENWPIIGVDNKGNGIGEPVEEYDMPKHIIQPAKVSSNITIQEKLAFQWSANPEPNYQMEYNGIDRYYAILNNDSIQNLWNFPALHLRKLPAEKFVATAQLNFKSLQEGERAGFIVFGTSYAGLCLEFTGNKLNLQYIECNNANKKGVEKKSLIATNIPNSVFGRIAMNKGGLAAFSYSLDGQNFIPISNIFKAEPGMWVGSKIGTFCSSIKTTNDAGWLEVASFKIEK